MRSNADDGSGSTMSTTIATTVPIAIPRTDLHSFFLNSAALKAAGLKNSVHVQGGVLAWAAQVDPSLPTY